MSDRKRSTKPERFNCILKLMRSRFQRIGRSGSLFDQSCILLGQVINFNDCSTNLVNAATLLTSRVGYLGHECLNSRNSFRDFLHRFTSAGNRLRACADLAV